MAHKKETGFTLIESLVVLLIGITISTIVFQYGFKNLQERAEQEAIDLLVATLYDMQSYAIGHAEYVVLDFVDNDQEGIQYVVKNSKQEELVTRTLPKGMSVSVGNNIKILGYHPNGRIMYFGSLLIKTKNRTVRLALQMHHGRVIVYEE